MAKKNFQTAPKPAVTLENIEAFEQGGVGKDKAAEKRVAAVTEQEQRTEVPAPKVTRPKKTPLKSATALKRISVDIDQELHMRFKIACTATGRKMTSELEAFIKKRTEQLEKEAGINR